MNLPWKFFILTFILFHTLKVSSQDIELLRREMSQEDYMILLIDSLEFSQSTSDTSDVVRFSSILVTEFQSSRMKDRALEYLNLALHYSSNYSDPAPYFYVCYRAGMYYSSRMRDEGIASPHYFNMIKEERMWHNRAIANEAGNFEAEFLGHFGVLMNMKMVFDDIGIRNDSIEFHFEKMTEINKIDSTILLLPASKNYIDYLIHTDNFEKADSLINSILPRLPKMDNKTQKGFLNAIHDLIAKKNNLDTLINLRRKSVFLFSEVMGANHSDKLYAADQKFEVTVTKDALKDTKDQLYQSKKVLIGSIITTLFITFISFYFYSLYRKNKQLSKRNEVLLKEQNHRVKNNLQMISSLLSLQSQKLLSSDAKEALTDSQARVNSVALLHRMLYEGEQVGFVDVDQYLKSLTEEVKYASHRELEVQLEVIEGLTLKVERATSLGLILNELMTNSIKHARTNIILLISISIIKSEDQITLNYIDNGEEMDIEDWKNSDSFGNQLIKIQSEQMNGKYRVSNSSGFSFNLRIVA